jgi:nucleoside-diphosphate-sugar epimerase
MIIHGHSEPRNPTRVVVLGGSGFVGRNLLGRLATVASDIVAPVSRDLDLSAPDGAHLLATLLRPTDAVVMLAASNSGARLDPDSFVANAAMGAAFWNAVRTAGCCHVVYLSSDAVYPFRAEPIDEDVDPVPGSLYALMHLARETMLRRLEGPPVAILRVAQIYGAGDPHGAYGPGRMVRSALREGRIALYGAGQETRDHIHVDDVASVILDALRMRSRGLVNVATGCSTSFAALANLVVRTCGGSVTIEHEPPLMPVLHRSFDTAALEAAFPSRSNTALPDGIRLLVSDELRTASAPGSLRRQADRADIRDQKWNGSGETGGSRDPEVPPVAAHSSPPLPEPDSSR